MRKTPIEAIKRSEFFDEEFYKKNYPIGSEVEPAEHYLRIGWRLCYDPSEKFSTAGYLYKNVDVLKAGINPLLHYEQTKEREKRSFLSSEELLESTKLFDPYYYIMANLEGFVHNTESDAVAHYLREGWKQNLNVSEYVDMHEYIDGLCDNEKICVPLLHYIVFECVKNKFDILRNDIEPIEIIRNSELFDEFFYKSCYGLNKDIDAARHYFEYGADNFFDPSKDFSTSGYYFVNKDIYEKRVNPLYHYELKGKDEKRRWESTQSVILKSSLFDVDFYCAEYLYEYIDEKKYAEWAAKDFITNGSKEHRKPNKDFVASVEGNEFVSFIQMTLTASDKTSLKISDEQGIELIKKSKLFNAKWYKDKYGISSENLCAAHYYSIGWKLKCDPSPDFCTEWYLDKYMEELSDDINPLVHYESFGKGKGYAPTDPIINVIRKSALFNEKWYAEKYLNGDFCCNAIFHYIKEGAYKGFPASPSFSSARYLINRRDVYDSGMNPLYHYIKYGKGKNDIFTLFKNDDNVKAYDKVIQDSRISQEYSPDTENLILFLLPTSDSIGGGVMSINSIAKVTCELTETLEEIKNYKVLLATYPSNYTFSNYTKFDCPFNIYRFNMLRNFFTNLQNLIIHIPEVMVGSFITQISPEDYAWLYNIENVKINILNQNNDMMSRPAYTKFLSSFAKDVTMTCAHQRYCTPNQRSSYNIPVHMLSTSNLVKYKYKPYKEKEPLLLYSPDLNDSKKAILDSIGSQFPDLKMKMIKNIPYNEYLELISRAKWMITFGEGLDGYAMESIRSGAISFAVFNHTFFNERFEGLPNIYSSYQDMLANIAEDMKKFDDPAKYKELNDILRKKDSEEKDEARYRNNIKNYYLGNYTYPIEDIKEQREKRMAEKPLVSIVMATYNGEKYLEKQLNSLCQLTYENIELIISDDGSTDNTLSIIERYSDRLNISVYHNDGVHGTTTNFENGLNHINGEYVALCDQDDIWMPDHIEKLLWQIDDFDIIHGRLTVIDENDKFHPASIMHTNYEISKVQYTSVEDYLEVPRMLGCASLIRASALKSCLPFPKEIPYHDWWITIKCIMDGKGICFTDEIVTKYRQHGENTAYSEYQDGTRIRKQLEFMKYLKKLYADKFTKHQIDLIDRIENWCILYPIFKDAAGKGMDPYFSAHRTDFSNSVMDHIISAYKTK